VGIAAARARYEQISEQTRGRSDFRVSDLERSRRLFELASPGLPTRAFDVITCVVGLPLPNRLQRALLDKRREILGLIPAACRVYQVDPTCMHWEAHIVQRPDEPDPGVPREDLVRAVRRAVGTTPAFTVDFGGFFVSPEGTVCFQGLGEWDLLRRRLREQLPCSSPDQLETGHVSAARILDPVGSSAFARLVALRDASSGDRYGTLRVDEVKLVLERRWYMEDHTVVAVARTGVDAAR
jgi:hypothetical protein